MGSLYLLLIFLIPIWGINEAPLGIRITLSVITLLLFVSLLAIVQNALKDRSAELAEDVKTPSPLFKHGLAWIWLVAVSGASAATHRDPNMPVFGWLITNVSRVGETLIPLVAKYRGQMGMPAPLLFRVQGVMSFMMLASLATILLLIVLFVVYGDRIKSKIPGQAPASAPEKHSFWLFLGALFFIYAGIGEYYGWRDFSYFNAGDDRKSQLAPASYYVFSSDFNLFFTAIFKVSVIALTAGSIFHVFSKILKIGTYFKNSDSSRSERL